MANTQNIPKNTWKYNLRDERTRLANRKIAIFVPLGLGATGKEGTPIIASTWDTEVAKLMGTDPVNKSLIDGFAENTANSQFTLLPFNMETATPAKGSFDISYTDISLPGSTDPTPSFTAIGKVVFAINEKRFEVTTALYDTAESLADSIIAIIMSDGDLTATKQVNGDVVTVELVTVSTGETANLTSFEWLKDDVDYVLPANATFTDALFSGGEESTDLAEKIALYKIELRNAGYTQFMSPYIDEPSLKQIYEGFNLVWDDQIVNDIQFVPMMHIVVISVDTIIDAQEYALQNANLTLSIIPEKSFTGDLAKRMGRDNGSIFMEYQSDRIVNGMNILVANLTPTNYWTEQEADTLIGYGLSPMGESNLKEPMIIRLVSSYKEAIDSQPISMLASVLGAIWVIVGVVIFNEIIKNKKYILVNSRAGGNKVTAGMIGTDLYNFIVANYVEGDDRIIDEFPADNVSVTKVSDNSINSVITFTIPDGLTFMSTSLLQILGG